MRRYWTYDTTTSYRHIPPEINYWHYINNNILLHKIGQELIW